MPRHHVNITLLLLILFALTGCSTVMKTSPLPDGFSLKEVAKTDLNTPFAVNNSGRYATVLDGNLNFVDPNAPPKPVAKGVTTMLSFSPSGDKLAAAFPVQDPKVVKTVLRIFDKGGNVIAETTVAGKLSAMVWRSDEQLLTTSVFLTRFSFGSGMASNLEIWDGKTPPVVTVLNDITIRPVVAKFPDPMLYGSVHLALSPYGDEVAYSTLKDPPMFTPYLKVATRHLETGAERQIGETSVGSGPLLYTPDGENLLVPDNNGLTRKLTIPEGKEINAWPASGDSAAISPSGAYLFLDGRLFQDMREIAWFPRESKAAFLPDGSGMAISYMDKVYLLSGLNDKPRPPLPSDMGRLLQLRRLRSKGLITEKEYRAEKAKIPVQR